LTQCRDADVSASGPGGGTAGVGGGGPPALNVGKILNAGLDFTKTVGSVIGAGDGGAGGGAGGGGWFGGILKKAGGLVETIKASDAWIDR
jgi:hypothetical protein